MKFLTKLTLYIVIFIAFTLTSCTKIPEPAMPVTSFTAKVTCNNHSYTVSHSGSSLTAITCHTPPELNGLTYSFRNNKMSVNYNSLVYTPSAGLQIKNNATEVYNALSQINSQGTYLKSTTKSTATYTTPTADIICNITTGEIQQILIKNNTNIYKFQFIN